MASRRQHRGVNRRRAQPAPPPSTSADAHDGPPPLSLSRAQAAQALGVSLRTLDRQVVPRIESALLEDGTRLIPLAELERYLQERTQPARVPMAATPGRRAIPEPVRERIRSERRAGLSYRQIAERLQADGIPTAQSGTRWWVSTVRFALLRDPR